MRIVDIEAEEECGDREPGIDGKVSALPTRLFEIWALRCSSRPGEKEFLGACYVSEP